MDDEDDRDSAELPVSRNVNVTHDEAATTVEDLESIQHQFDAANAARDLAKASTLQAIKQATSDTGYSDMLRLALKPLADLKDNLAAMRVTATIPASHCLLGAATSSFLPPVITRQAAADLAHSEMIRKTLDPLASVTSSVAVSYPMGSELAKVPSFGASM